MKKKKNSETNLSLEDEIDEVKKEKEKAEAEVDRLKRELKELESKFDILKTEQEKANLKI